jgi:hypothetical protein
MIPATFTPADDLETISPKTSEEGTMLGKMGDPQRKDLRSGSEHWRVLKSMYEV